MNDDPTDTAVAARLRSVLLDLARRLEDRAVDELAATPYWSPCPVTVVGRRTAAEALRTEADLLLAAS